MRQLKITKSITNRESASLDKYLQAILLVARPELRRVVCSYAASTKTTSAGRTRRVAPNRT